MAQNLECCVARAVAGVELGVWIAGNQSFSQFFQLFFALLSVEQMKSAYDSGYRPLAGIKNVFQTAVGTPREEQSVWIECQFVAEIIVY